MKELLKKTLNGGLKRSGYRIADERNIHDEYSFINRLKATKLHPKTVIGRVSEPCWRVELRRAAS